jgi:hypothetical protein
MPYYQGSSANKASSQFVTRNQQRFNLSIDKDWSEREAKLHILQKFLDSTIYDHLSSWHMEYNGTTTTSQYIPLSQRRPCITYRLPEIIVNESISMLFGQEHFPRVRSETSEESVVFINYLNDNFNIIQAMLNAAYVGSLGSVCVLVKVLNNKFYLDVLNTACLTPIFKQDDPGVLKSLIEKRKYDGATLLSYGYKIDEEDIHERYYIIREWTETDEIYYKPILCDLYTDKEMGPEIDDERSTHHALGFVPAIWAKNTNKTCGIDGMCTFEAIVDISVEIDYQLSQLGRLLKYNSDPTLVIKNPSSLEGNQLIKSVGALNLDEKGDAYLLEMSNASTNAVIDYVRCLREFALEVVRGNRANPDKISALHSGKALQMLNSSLIGLVGEMRICYGDNLLLPLYKMMAEIANHGTYSLVLNTNVPSVHEMDDLKLDWPAWYPPTPQDEMQESQTLQVYTATGIVSRRTALETVADEFNITDIDKEMRQIEEETEQDAENQVKVAQKTNDSAPDLKKKTKNNK